MIRPLRAVVSGIALFALTVSACGGGGRPTKTASGGGGEGNASARPSDGSPEARQALGKSERIPSPKLLDRRSRSGVASDSLGLARSSARPPQSAAELYRTVAPATVIIRVPGGIGTGVVIDPAGWVLTNNHVVELGESQDFRVKVSVMLGKLSAETGGMVRQEQLTFDGVVYKSDELRDLALLKLEGAPKNLPYVKIASHNPAPGEQVVSIGHAGAGMLWAIKPGEISALGKLSEQLAILAQFKNDAEGKQAEQSFKKYLDDQNLGLVIQSTCNILPGDSGGPLVTKRGELVGLNAFSNKDPRTGGLLSFHIHRQEIAKFVKDRPKKPAQIVPDPWKDGGSDASFEDADLDGRADVLLMQGSRPCSFCPRQSAAVFIDLDQSTFPRRRPLPPLKTVFEKRSFDAELVYLQLEKDAYVWYDGDDDGKFDVLLVDRGISGRSASAYRIKPDGELVKDEALASGRVIRTALFKNSALHQRLTRVAAAAFPEHYLEATTTALSDRLPNPVGRTGNGRAGDLDGDGVRDALRVDTAFSTRLLIDVDQSSLKSLASEVSLSETRRSKIDPEVAVVSQSTQMWVYYDTDDDGRMDLALHSPSANLHVATEAWKIDAARNKTVAGEHIGRKLIRAALVPPAARSRWQRIIDKGFPDLMSAKTDDGFASFPHPIEDHRAGRYELLEVKGLPRRVVVIHGEGSEGYLVDFEGNSLRGKPSSEELSKAVGAGKIDAEYAYFQRNGLAWAYFDTDGKKRFDVVLYTANPRGGKADHGFRIGDDGKVTLDASLTGAALASHSLYKRKSEQTKMEKLGRELFGQRALD